MPGVATAPSVVASGGSGALAESGAPGQRGRKSRLLAVITLAVVGLAAVGGGVAGLVWAHTRKPTPAQVTAAGDKESALLWRSLTAGQLFPATVNYTDSLEARNSATLVGIAPRASCAAAFNGEAATALTAAGCVTVLRATYANESHTALATIGVAVMPSAAAAQAMSEKMSSGVMGGGLLPVSFPGTIAASFAGQAAGGQGLQGATGPYLLFYSNGFADGRPMSTQVTSAGTGNPFPADLATQVAQALLDRLYPPSDPCAVKEIRYQP